MGESARLDRPRAAGTPQRPVPETGILDRVSGNSSHAPRSGGAASLEWLHRNDAIHQEPQMITFFFAFATVGFFAAIVAQVVGTVSSPRSFG